MTFRSWSSRFSNSGIAFKRALSIGSDASRFRGIADDTVQTTASCVRAVTQRRRRLAAVPLLEIHARDEHSRARAGTIHLAHGRVRTPAFVPLATKAVLKTLEPHEV